MLTQLLGQEINWPQVGARGFAIALTWVVVWFLVRHLARWLDRLAERVRPQAIERRDLRSLDAALDALLITAGVGAGDGVDADPQPATQTSAASATTTTNPRRTTSEVRCMLSLPVRLYPMAGNRAKTRWRYNLKEYDFLLTRFDKTWYTWLSGL